MRKLVLGSVTCVTLLMLALGTSAVSSGMDLVAGGAPPPGIDELMLAGGAPPPGIDEILLAGGAPPPGIDEVA